MGTIKLTILYGKFGCGCGIQLVKICFFITVFLQDIDCFLFDNKNETAIINLDCDKGNHIVEEGNIGQTNLFPWLGVLRVHIHEKGKSFRIAVTGIVLVKDKYAIGNANDISKIPESKLRSDSKVMFITVKDVPWFCDVVDYMPHPEYEITTVNTVGVLELNRGLSRIRVTPICWPYTNFNTSDQLYTIGYTDENQRLEKVMRKLEFVDKTLCNEFYHRSKLAAADMSVPANYRCAFAVNSHKNCTWDNGMVVASNASGQWTLIGLIIGGPGCAAPARFVDTTAYLPWLETTMNLEGGNFNGPSEDIIMRRALRDGIKRNNYTDTETIGPKSTWVEFKRNRSEPIIRKSA